MKENKKGYKLSEQGGWTKGTSGWWSAQVKYFFFVNLVFSVCAFVVQVLFHCKTVQKFRCEIAASKIFILHKL